MADDDLSALAPDLPPQATGNTLPGQAADLADIAPAPSAEQALLQSHFGDKGAEQYAALQKAGQRSPTAPSAPVTPAPSAPAPDSGTNLGNSLSDLLGGALAGYATSNPAAGLQIVEGRQKMQQQAAQQQAQLQAQQQQMALKGMEFLNNLRKNNVPPDVRIAMIHDFAASQGMQLTPSQSAYISHLSNDPSLSQHLLERIKGGDLTAVDEYNSMFSGDPAKLLQAVNAARKSDADTDKAVADAQQSQFKVTNQADAAATKDASAAAQTAQRIRSAQRPPSRADLEALDAAGLAAWQVDMPNVPGQKMWTTGPKAMMPASAAIDLTKLHETEATTAAAKAQAKEQGTTTAATRTMKEKVPKVRGLAAQVAADLDKIEAGPFASRLQDFMAGTIGAPNPDFIHYKDNAVLLGSLLMNMHSGSRGSEYMGKKFDDLIGATYQSPENMRSTLDVINRYTDIVDGAKEGAIISAPPELSAAGPPVKVATPADAAKLAPGTKFVTPDGQVRVRN